MIYLINLPFSFRFLIVLFLASFWVFEFIVNYGLFGGGGEEMECAGARGRKRILVSAQPSMFGVKQPSTQ